MPLLLFVMNTHVSANPFQLDEEGKFFIQEEVLTSEMDQRRLWQNAVSYVTKVRKAGEMSHGKPQLEKNIIRKEGSFYVYKKGLFTPQIHGEIIFQVEIEVDKDSYKYTFSDFVFQFYQKNRYGQFVPVSGKIKPLEDERFAGMQEAWEEYKEMTRKVVGNHIRVLKTEMQRAHNSSYELER